MNPEIIALISFVAVTTYTPEQNNISSASMGVLYGYKRTLPYMLGISSRILYNADIKRVDLGVSFGEYSSF